MDLVINAGTSNKINRFGFPSYALKAFTEHTPPQDLAMDYIYESVDTLVKGLLLLKYRDSFQYSFVGGYMHECRKYLLYAGL